MHTEVVANIKSRDEIENLVLQEEKLEYYEDPPNEYQYYSSFEDMNLLKRDIFLNNQNDKIIHANPKQ